MRSKQGVDYCVACNELDSDDVKDNPGITIMMMMIMMPGIFTTCGVKEIIMVLVYCHKVYTFGSI